MYDRGDTTGTGSQLERAQQFEDRGYSAEVLYSSSHQDIDSGDENTPLTYISQMKLWGKSDCHLLYKVAT